MLPWPPSWKEPSLTNTTATFKQAIRHCHGCWAIYAVCASSTQGMMDFLYRIHPMSNTKAKQAFPFTIQCHFLFPIVSYLLTFLLPFLWSLECQQRQQLSLHHYWESKLEDDGKDRGIAIWDPFYKGRKMFMLPRASPRKDYLKKIFGNREYFKVFSFGLYL
jgi:hypothetical protein